MAPSPCPERVTNPLIFKQEGWKDFRTFEGLSRKAGVAQMDLGELALKELVDNGRDAAGRTTWSATPDGFYVEDDGPGLPGTDEEIAALFSVRRPLTTSKLLRLPTRGALGNGLRVVAGLALSSGGEIRVSTRGRVLVLTPRFHDGGTDVRPAAPWEKSGTRIEVQWPGDIMEVPTGKWLTNVPSGVPYLGRSSAHWYDSASFFELVNAAGRTPVRALLAELEGLTGGKAGRVAGEFRGRTCESLTREETGALLARARSASKPVKATRLGLAFEGGEAYARATAEFTVKGGKFDATVPFGVEVLVEPATMPEIVLTVNRTLLPGDIELYRFGNEALSSVTGCGLDFEVKAGKRRVWRIRVNILTPFYPKTSDGKHPDLNTFEDCLQETIEKAIRKARRVFAPPAGTHDDDDDEPAEPSASCEQQVLTILERAIDRASGDRTHGYSQGQLWYPCHELTGGDNGPLVGKARRKYFATIIAREEQRRGCDLPGMYRDPRGTLYTPHSGESLALGTLAVEAYERPLYRFNKILFMEKEGPFPLLKAERWPEKNDCALVTSKGQATRAAKDLIDLLGDGDEPITVYCIHDADAAGTIIYQALQEATIARPRRRVEIVNLGLEPAEALAMGLSAESVATGERARPVARYVTKKWREWLQSNRVELNAMTTPQFLAWLDKKFIKTAKLIPPANVLRERLAAQVREIVQSTVEEEIRAKFDIEQMVEARMESVLPLLDSPSSLKAAVSKAFKGDRSQSWNEPIDRIAVKVACKVVGA